MSGTILDKEQIDQLLANGSKEYMLIDWDDRSIQWRKGSALFVWPSDKQRFEDGKLSVVEV